jgi:L-gulono-1,4-lactone dehydrogenase
VYQVKALFRTRTNISDQCEARGCSIVWGDVTKDDALRALVADTKFVFHCAAITGRASYRDAHTVNVEGTRRLALAAEANGCGRFVHVSSAAVYSASTNADYTEDTELREGANMPVYSLTKLQSERALQAVAREHGLDYTIIRPTCVYGPSTKPYTTIPIALIRKGIPVIVGAGEGLLDVVYVRDVVAAMLLAAQSQQASGQVFNIGHETVTFNEFYAHFGRLLNRPVRHLPVAVVNAMVRLHQAVAGSRNPSARELERGVAFLKEMAANTRAYPSAKAAALIGYAPRYSLTTGMLETELWLKANGMLPTKRHAAIGYGSLRFRPRAVVHPMSEQELTQITRIGSTSGINVRAIGSLHSLCAIPQTAGICIVLDRYDRLLKVEGPLVTVQAGMRIRDLNEILARNHLALPVSGSIAAQTVSGAISTGTHGGSIHFGSLSDCVHAVRIIRADGSVHELDHTQDCFHAAVVSLGLLGIISTVTFRCVPSFVLQSRHTVRKVRDVIREFYEICRESAYVDMLYFPILDEVAVMSMDRVEGAVGHVTVVKTPRDEPETSYLRKLGRKLVVGAAKASAWTLFHVGFPPLERALAKRAIRSFSEVRTGRSDLVLAFLDAGSRDRSPIPDMEIAIPYGQAGAALELLREHFRGTKRFPLMPVHIRCSPHSQQWLSPAYQREVCWLEFWQFPPSDRMFERIHELLRHFGYRFHWGKEAKADRAYIEQQYERWNDFKRLRNEWDPNSVFSNRYLNQFFDR